MTAHRGHILRLPHPLHVLYQLHQDRHLPVSRLPLRQLRHRALCGRARRRVCHERDGHHVRTVRPHSGIEARHGVERAELVRDREVFHGHGTGKDGFEERLRAGDCGRLEEVGEGSAGELGRVVDETL